MSKLEVDAIEPQSGTTLTIGASGDTVNIASGATITDFTSTGIDDNATSTAITIDSSERVGIGTLSPTVTLEVSGSALIGGQIVATGSTTTTASRRAIITHDGSSMIFKASGDSTNRNIIFEKSGDGATDETMRIDTSGNLKFNSGYGSVATAYGCRAWVNFDGTGTVAIRDGKNVSSITDNGTGSYTVNFITNMPDANYAWNIGIGRTGAQSGGAVAFTSTLPSAGALRVLRFKENFASHDEEFMCITIFR